MKGKYIIILSIIFSIVTIGCGKTKIVERFVNYFNKEAKIIEQFEKDNKEVKDKIAQANDLKELSHDLDQIIENCKKNRDELNKLPTPVELIDYNTATNKYMNTTIENIRDIKLVIDSNDLEFKSNLDQRFQEMDKTKAVQKKEMYKAIEKATKEAGITYQLEGDRILFR